MAPSSTTHFSFPCFFQPERSLPFHSETHSGAIVCAGALEGCARSGIAIEKQKANEAARSSLCFIILFFILFFIASLPAASGRTGSGEPDRRSRELQDTEVRALSRARHRPGNISRDRSDVGNSCFSGGPPACSASRPSGSDHSTAMGITARYNG